jgi:hypothetical protein
MTRKREPLLPPWIKPDLQKFSLESIESHGNQENTGAFHRRLGHLDISSRWIFQFIICKVPNNVGAAHVYYQDLVIRPIFPGRR